MSRRTSVRRTRRLLVGAALLAAGAVHAQAPDASAIVRPDSSRRAMALPEPPSGRRLAPVPAVTPALTLETLLADAPGAWVYALGAPGRAGGVVWDGLDRWTLTLDGRPFADLFTGAPRADLLPAEVLAPTVATDAGGGLSVEAATRTFRLAVPVTELRYHAGGDGVQAASGVHAQTRRAPRWLAAGAPDARVTASLHAATRNASPVAPGAELRHTHALGRLLLARPGLALDLGVLYAERTDGARRGIAGATVLDPAASRGTRRTDVWATARVPGVGAPATVRAALARQTLVYSAAPGDTLRSWTHQVSASVEQRLGRPWLRLGAAWDADPSGGTDPLGDPGARLSLHAEARDTLAVGAARLALAGGAASVDGSAWPTAAVRLAGRRVGAGVRYGGEAPGRIEASGLDGRIAPAERPGRGRALAADAHVRAAAGPLTVGLRAAASRRWNAALLVARGDTAWAYETAASPLDRAALTADAAWREATTRGVYLRAAATASAALRPDASPLHRREADALPRLHGTLRVGARATGVGGVLDLDLAATARGWTAFASRVVEPATGALALPDPASALGAGVPAGGTVDVWATAAFSSRAIVVLGVENVFARAVSVAVVPGEPLPGPVWRVGILWALLD